MIFLLAARASIACDSHGQKVMPLCSEDALSSAQSVRNGMNEKYSFVDEIENEIGALHFYPQRAALISFAI
ncbi:hypothetical protein [Hyphomicrobium sp. 2TAF46]|uniref:hypothetical protein n=1 Tax=Hyphomicrobium sp. 2TAF46 TaxID=3233019 RepID=UPI003F905438